MLIYISLENGLDRNDMALIYAWVMWVKGDTNLLQGISEEIILVIGSETDNTDIFMKYPTVPIIYVGT